MKKHNVVKSLALALGSAALLWGTINLPASDTLSRNAAALRANGGTTFDLLPTAVPGVFTHTVNGIAQVSLLGNCSVHADVIVQFSTNPDEPAILNGSLTFTTADGATTLTTHVEGTGTPDPANPNSFLNFQYQVRFTGGSGRFAAARGKAAINGAALFTSASTGKATWTLQGYVVTPP